MRRVSRGGLAIICLFMLYAVALAAPQYRTALVIGNAAYREIGVLRNPVNDASDMAAMLQQLKFEVTLLRDVDLRATREAVDITQPATAPGWSGAVLFCRARGPGQR